MKLAARAASASFGVPRGRYLIEIGAFLAPLVFWPALPQAFSTPKIWLLAGLAAALVALALKTTSRGREWPLLVWPVAASLSALTAPYVLLRALSLAVMPVAICWAAMRCA